MQLPGELWIEIFTIAVLSDFPLPIREDRQRPSRELYHLLSVCRTWYALITSTPLLWTKIQVDEENILETTVLRSGTHLPLQLHLFHDPPGEVPCEDLRVTSLCIHAASQNWFGLDEYSNLKTLVLSSISGSSVFVLPPPSTFPRLRVLQVIGKVSLFSVESADWSNLNDLIVDSTATKDGPHTGLVRNVVADGDTGGEGADLSL